MADKKKGLAARIAEETGAPELPGFTRTFKREEWQLEPEGTWINTITGEKVDDIEEAERTAGIAGSSASADEDQALQQSATGSETKEKKRSEWDDSQDTGWEINQEPGEKKNEANSNSSGRSAGKLPVPGMQERVKVTKPALPWVYQGGGKEKPPKSKGK